MLNHIITRILDESYNHYNRSRFLSNFFNCLCFRFSFDWRESRSNLVNSLNDAIAFIFDDCLLFDDLLSIWLLDWFESVFTSSSSSSLWTMIGSLSKLDSKKLVGLSVFFWALFFFFLFLLLFLLVFLLLLLFLLLSTFTFGI